MLRTIPRRIDPEMIETIEIATTPLPTLEQLRTRHSEHVNDCLHWQLLDAIVAGGRRMDMDMKRLLLANPDGRPPQVMEERLKLATYCNKIGPILTRFNSELFARPASKTGSTEQFWEDQFFPKGAVLKGDDDARAGFDLLLSDAMLQALTTGKAIAQVDTRISSGQASNRQAQEALGELEPYVVLHPRSALWDWDADKDGFKFAKLHQFRMVRNRWSDPPIPEHDFTIYERMEEDNSIIASRYTIRKRLKDGEKPPTGPLDLDDLKDKDVEIRQILQPSPIFNIKGKFKFPLLTLTLPDSLWMADQLFEPQKSYYNQTAALEWGIYTTNYAIPVISGVEDEDDDPGQDQKFGDGYYLTLRTGQTLSWAERGGSGFSTAINYRGEIKRDIYDILQQIAMSAADGAAIIARSGASKKEDRRPTELLLERYGDMVRVFGTQILDVAAIAHGEEVEWEMEGFTDFLDEGLIEDITDFQGIQGVAVPSLTFKKETTKQFAKRVFRAMEVDSDKVPAMLDEIEAAKLEDFAPPQPQAAPAGEGEPTTEGNAEPPTEPEEKPPTEAPKATEPTTKPELIPPKKRPMGATLTR